MNKEELNKPNFWSRSENKNMINREKILQFLRNDQSHHYCDDCLSSLLKIYPRQQVNQICRKNINIIRKKDSSYCSGKCHKKKILNYVE